VTASDKANSIAGDSKNDSDGSKTLNNVTKSSSTQSKNVDQKKQSQAEFSFLSWNLCMLENSYQAPANWRMDQAESKVRERILEVSPDFVFFQELPGLVPYVETHELVPANTISHSGNIATLVRKDLFKSIESYTIAGFAVVTSVPSQDITIANVHLEPGKNGDYKRLDSIKRIVNRCKTSGLLIVGDTNTRTTEEESFEQIGLIGKRPAKATWNSRTNLFRKNGRKYTAYYTRYFHSQNLSVSKVKVWSDPLSIDGKKFHLSDHFAMSGSVSFSPAKSDKLVESNKVEKADKSQT